MHKSEAWRAQTSVSEGARLGSWAHEFRRDGAAQAEGASRPREGGAIARVQRVLEATRYAR